MDPMKQVLEAISRARLMHDQDQQEVVVLCMADFDTIRKAVYVPNGWKLVKVEYPAAEGEEGR